MRTKIYKLFIVFLGLMLLLIETCFANLNDGIRDAKDLSNDYKDIAGMLENGTNYLAYSDLYQKATIQNHRLERNYNNEVLMQNVIMEADEVQFLYFAIDEIWQHQITSNETDVTLPASFRDRYPRLKDLHGNFWGKFDSTQVLQTLVSYQDEKIQNFDNMIKTIKTDNLD